MSKGYQMKFDGPKKEAIKTKSALRREFCWSWGNMDFLFLILICFDNILFVRVCVRVCVCWVWASLRLCACRNVHFIGTQTEMFGSDHHHHYHIFLHISSIPTCVPYVSVRLCVWACVCACVCTCTPTRVHKCVYVSCVSKARTRQEFIPSDRGAYLRTACHLMRYTQPYILNLEGRDLWLTITHD